MKFKRRSAVEPRSLSTWWHVISLSRISVSSARFTEFSANLPAWNYKTQNYLKSNCWQPCTQEPYRPWLTITWWDQIILWNKGGGGTSQPSIFVYHQHCFHIGSIRSTTTLNQCERPKHKIANLIFLLLDLIVAIHKSSTYELNQHWIYHHYEFALKGCYEPWRVSIHNTDST